MRRSEKQDFVDAVRNKYAPSMPQIDREKYTDLPGLEGPFMLRSGKVVYYDPKEGKYYDRERDMYMDYDEYESHANPRESVGFYRFCRILEENMRNYRPEDDFELPHAWGETEFSAPLVLKNGTLHDTKRNRPLAAMPTQLLQGIIGAPDDTYTLTATVKASGDYMPGYDYGGGDAEDNKMQGDAEIEAEGFIVNDRTNEEVFIPEEVALRLFGKGPEFVYQVDHDDRPRNGKIKVSVF
jgi:hypothetical protein